MNQSNSSEARANDIEGTNHRNLFRFGRIAIIAVILLTLLSVITFLIWPNYAGTTSTLDIFKLIKFNFLAAATALDLGYWIINLIYIVIFICIYISLRRNSKSFSLIAFVLGLISVVSLIAARPVFQVFALSDSYFSAVVESIRNQHLASADTLLSKFHGGFWYISVLLSNLSQLISSVLMLRNKNFGKSMGVVGIIAFGIGSVFWIPAIGRVFLFISMLVSIVWMIMLYGKFTRKSNDLGNRLA